MDTSTLQRKTAQLFLLNGKKYTLQVEIYSDIEDQVKRIMVRVSHDEEWECEINLFLTEVSPCILNLIVPSDLYPTNINQPLHCA